MKAAIMFIIHVIKRLAITLATTLVFVGCHSEEKLESVVIVSVANGTIVEFPDKSRASVGYVWGKTGDQFKACKSGDYWFSNITAERTNDTLRFAKVVCKFDVVVSNLLTGKHDNCVTIVEFLDGTRMRMLGDWGELGEKFKTRKTSGIHWSN
jgi:hypothetical protein